MRYHANKLKFDLVYVFKSLNLKKSSISRSLQLCALGYLYGRVSSDSMFISKCVFLLVTVCWLKWISHLLCLISQFDPICSNPSRIFCYGHMFPSYECAACDLVYLTHKKWTKSLESSGEILNPMGNLYLESIKENIQFMFIKKLIFSCTC